MCKPKKLPIDYLKVLPEQDQSETNRYVPIDIDKIAAHLKTHPKLIFGGLYYHLNREYNYKMGGASPVKLFMPAISGEKFPTPQRNRTQFPFLTSILAELEEDQRRHSKVIKISIGVAVIAFMALVVNIVFSYLGSC